MKRFFSILGGIFLLIIILVVGFVGYSAFSGHQLDVSSKAYINANIPIIITSWSEEEFSKRASEELKSDLAGQQWDYFSAKMKRLGGFQVYDGCKGQAYISFSPEHGKVITANYKAQAEFQNGRAEIKVELVWRNGQWQIAAFTVDSPSLQK